MENPNVNKSAGMQVKPVATLTGKFSGKSGSGFDHGIDPNACFMSLCSVLLTTLGKTRLTKADVMLTFQSAIQDLQKQLDDALKALQGIGSSMKDITDKMGNLSPFAKMMINVGIMVAVTVVTAGIGAAIGAMADGAMSAIQATRAATAAEEAAKAATAAKDAATAAQTADEAAAAATKAEEAANSAQKAVKIAENAAGKNKLLPENFSRIVKQAQDAAEKAKEAAELAKAAATTSRDAATATRDALPEADAARASAQTTIDSAQTTIDSAQKIADTNGALITKSQELNEQLQAVKGESLFRRLPSCLPSSKKLMGPALMGGMTLGPQSAQWFIPGMGGTKMDYKLQELQTKQTDENQKISNLTAKQDSYSNGGQRTESSALDLDNNSSNAVTNIAVDAIKMERDYYVHAV